MLVNEAANFAQFPAGGGIPKRDPLVAVNAKRTRGNKSFERNQAKGGAKRARNPSVPGNAPSEFVLAAATKTKLDHQISRLCGNPTHFFYFLYLFLLAISLVSLTKAGNGDVTAHLVA
jgi:hypothetical protein